MVKKYDSFNHRVAEYVQDYVQMIKDRQDIIRGGRPTTEYNRLTKSRQRMKEMFFDYFEAVTSFAPQIYVDQFTPKDRKATGLAKAYPRNYMLEDLRLYDKVVTDQMRNKIKSMAIDLTQEIFDEKNLRRLFQMIFLYNRTEHKEILTEAHQEHYVAIATMMIKIGIGELKKYMDIQAARLLFADLERVGEICDLVKSSKDKEIGEWA